MQPEHFCSHNFTAQLASYFARDSLFDTSMSLELMANARKLFVQCPINRLSLLPQYVPTALLGSLLHASSSPTAACMVATNAACKLFVLLASVVLFQITKPGNVNRKKIFVGILDHENIFTQKLKHENFQIYGIKHFCRQ